MQKAITAGENNNSGFMTEGVMILAELCNLQKQEGEKVITDSFLNKFKELVISVIKQL